MTSKEKAEELVGLYAPFSNIYDEEIGWVDDIDSAKQCALICVDEILSASTIKLSETDSCKFVYIDDFWMEVKKEIEKL